MSKRKKQSRRTAAYARIYKRNQHKHLLLGGLGEPTKKDFVAIADLLCNHRASSSLIHAFANHFARENPRFDAGRFVVATNACHASPHRKPVKWGAK